MAEPNTKPLFNIDELEQHIGTVKEKTNVVSSILVEIIQDFGTLKDDIPATSNGILNSKYVEAISLLEQIKSKYDSKASSFNVVLDSYMRNTRASFEAAAQRMETQITSGESIVSILDNI